MEFAKRLNSIFDELDMPIRGRATALQRVPGVQITNPGAQKWLKGETMPRHGAIVAISRKYRKDPVWLEYGDVRHTTKGRSLDDSDEIEFDVQFCDIPLHSDGAESNGDSQNMESIPFRKSYLDKLEVLACDACMLAAPDARMQPGINEGDLMLIDRSKQEFEDRGIFVFDAGDSVRVNLVSMNIDGSVTLISTNNSPSYPNQTLSPEAAQALKIVGKVRWSGGPK